MTTERYVYWLHSPDVLGWMWEYWRDVKTVKV